MAIDILLHSGQGRVRALVEEGADVGFQRRQFRLDALLGLFVNRVDAVREVPERLLVFFLGDLLARFDGAAGARAHSTHGAEVLLRLTLCLGNRWTEDLLFLGAVLFRSSVRLLLD